MKSRRGRDLIHSATLFMAVTMSLFSEVFLHAGVALAARLLWIKLQNVTDPAFIVHVNGSYADETGTLTGSMDQYEYLRGRIIPLENLIGDRTDPPARRGEAYIQIHMPDSFWDPSKMYVSVKIPRFWDVTTRTDSGCLDLYFAFDTTDSCAQPDDRIIRLDFSQPDADSVDANGWPVNPVTYSVSEHNGVNPATDCTGLSPGEWPGFAQAASANAGSATGAAGAGSDSCPRLTHCWVSHALQS